MFDIFVNFVFQFGRNYQLSRHIHFYDGFTGVFPRGISVQGTPCPGVISVHGSLSGEFVQKGLCLGVSVQVMGGLCPVKSLPGGVSADGTHSTGTHPTGTHPTGTHPTGTHSCLIRKYWRGFFLHSY